jgi:hypothetical protein
MTPITKKTRLAVSYKHNELTNNPETENIKKKRREQKREGNSPYNKATAFLIPL